MKLYSNRANNPVGTYFLDVIPMGVGIQCMAKNNTQGVRCEGRATKVFNVHKNSFLPDNAPVPTSSPITVLRVCDAHCGKSTVIRRMGPAVVQQRG
jgi:hypothetical protein